MNCPSCHAPNFSFWRRFMVYFGRRTCGDCGVLVEVENQVLVRIVEMFALHLGLVVLIVGYVVLAPVFSTWALVLYCLGFGVLFFLGAAVFHAGWSVLVVRNPKITTEA